MSTFKAGDKVEYLVAHDGRAAGTKGTVLSGGGGNVNEIIVVEDEFGKTNHAFARRFKLVEEPVAALFNVGDKVKPIGEGLGFEGDTVTVAETNRKGAYRYLVRGADGTTYPCHEHELEALSTTTTTTAGEKPVTKIKSIFGKTLTITGYDSTRLTIKPGGAWADRGLIGDGVFHAADLIELLRGLGHIPAEQPTSTAPTTIKAKDAQVGDTIRRIYTFADGSTITQEGVVESVDGSYISAKSITLALKGDDTDDHVTFELLNRPEPVKAPEPWETARAGDVLFRMRPDGKKDTFVKNADGGWTINYPGGGAFHIYPTEDVAGYFRCGECVAPQLA